MELELQRLAAFMEVNSLLTISPIENYFGLRLCRIVIVLCVIRVTVRCGSRLLLLSSSIRLEQNDARW